MPFAPATTNDATPVSSKRTFGVFRTTGYCGLLVAGVCASGWNTSDNGKFPFSIGERLTYEVSVGRTGKVGQATMWVEGPIDVRGTSTYLLRFDSRVRIALLTGTSRSSSWFDPARGASLRYLKHERNPLTSHDESVEMYPDEKRWKNLEGGTGESANDIPLDELSFMFFIRTLPLAPGAVHHFDRHFDRARNPITVRMIRRETIPTPMGERRTFLVEMRVRDPRHYKGEGTIRIHLSDDACRVPVRIESRMPIIGVAVMTIDSQQTRCARS
jgi:hypothetical protein